MHPFVTGLLIGTGVSVVGAVLDYALYIRTNLSRPHEHPSIMLVSALALGIAGVLGLPVSWVLTGGIKAGLLVGLGVLVGFYAGFALLLLGWFVTYRAKDTGQAGRPSPAVDST